jgi:hypothetical protein
MSDFWRTHFDKVLLSALFLITLGTFMFFTRELAFFARSDNAAHLVGVVNWLENTVGQVLAALLTLMVGRSLGAASATATPGGGVSVTTSSTPPAAPTGEVVQASVKQ